MSIKINVPAECVWSCLAFTFICVLQLASAPVAAESSSEVSMAVRDWVLRDALSAEHARRVPAYCSGDYVIPAYDWSIPEPDLEGDQQPVEGTASFLQADRDRWIRMSGSVKLKQGGWFLETETAYLDRQSNRVSLPAGVVMRSQTTAIEGEGAEIDLQEKRFELDNATYLLYNQHARGSADRIYSVEKNKLFVEGSRYTTCPPGSQAWELSSSDLTLDQSKGEGRASNLVLRVQDMPLLWFPWLAFPLDDRRRSGFLYPSITNSNTGRGIDLAVPYYFNLAPHYDLTYTPRYIHGRGLFSEFEARHLSRISKSEARLGYISQDREYEKSGGRDAHRWAIDFVNETRPVTGWRSIMDINAVSDSEYLRDLNRTLEIAEQSYILRTWQVQYFGPLNFNSRVHAYQTIDEDIPVVARPYLLLPQFSLLYGWAGTGLTFDVESEYTYFWRDRDKLPDNAQVIGSRIRTMPSLAFPVSTTWGYITPRLSLDHTDYLLDQQRAEIPDHQSRTVPFVSLDSGIFLDRQTRMFGREYNQSLEPRLFYVYSKETFQEDIPNFDTSVATFGYSRLFKEDRFVGGDRVGDNNRITVGLTTRFNDLDQGIEILRASIGQIYYLDDQEVTLLGQGGDDEENSPLAAELIWRPNERMDVKVEGQWSPDDSRTDRGSTTLSFHDDEYETLANFSHRYDNSNIDPLLNLEQAEISGLFTVSPPLALIGRWLFDLTRHRTIGLLAGFEYSSCCWRVQVLMRDALVDASNDPLAFAQAVNQRADIDRSYFLRFELRGLGSLSNQLEEVLSQEMRNFGERDRYRKERYRW